MRICSLRVPRLKDEWNQMVWSVNNLSCGTAGLYRQFLEEMPPETANFTSYLTFEESD
jgi:hypothetical protein